MKVCILQKGKYSHANMKISIHVSNRLLPVEFWLEYKTKYLQDTNWRGKNTIVKHLSTPN